MLGPSRRDFIKVVTSYLLGLTGVLGLAGAARFLSYESAPRRQAEFDLGPASGFAMNSRTRLDQVPALMIRHESGFLAISMVCTHLGCTVQEAKEGFACPCHGSRYDDHGEVLRGPATRPLPRLRTEITAEGRLILHAE